MISSMIASKSFLMRLPYSPLTSILLRNKISTNVTIIPFSNSINKRFFSDISNNNINSNTNNVSDSHTSINTNDVSDNAVPITDEDVEISPSRIILFPSDYIANDDIRKVVSIDTANQKGLTKYKINVLIKKFQIHKTDTGSAAVQIAALTVKIRNLVRHFLQHKRDRLSNRGFQHLISRRKALMQYLLKYDIKAFQKVIIDMDLAKEAASLRYNK